MTSRKTLIIFAHGWAAAVKTHRHCSALFFLLGKRKKNSLTCRENFPPFSNDTVVGVVDRISKWKKTGQRAIGCLLNTHFVCTQY